MLLLVDTAFYALTTKYEVEDSCDHKICTDIQEV